MRVLVIEHNYTDVKCSCRYLQQYFPPVRIVHSSSGADALTKVKDEGYDLILLGVPLADMKYHEFLTLLQAESSIGKVMAMLPWEERSFLRELLDLGVCDFVYKPLQEAEFQARLQRFFSATAETAAGFAAHWEKEILKTALRESEARYKMLFESANDAILILKEGYFIECNQKALELYGASREEITGQTPDFFSPLLQPDGNFSRTKALERVELARHNMPQLFEWRHHRLDGTPLDVEVSLNRISYQGETLIQAIVRDITGRKRVEAALQYRIEFDNLITSLSTNFINHPTTKINDAISSALQQIGEFAGVDRCYVFMLSDNGKRVSNTHEWCAPGIVPQIQSGQNIDVAKIRWFMNQLAQLQPIHLPSVWMIPDEAVEERKIMRDQSIQSILMVPMVIGDALAGFLGFDSVKDEKMWSEDSIILLNLAAEMFTNALERQRVEEALQESEERYRSLIENLPLGVYRTEPDPEGKIVMANRAFLNMLGYEMDRELIGSRMNELYLNPEERSALCSRIFTARESVEFCEILLKKRDGSPVWISDRTRVIYSDGGEPLYLDCTAEDITQRKMAEEALRNSEERYREILATIEEGYYETDTSGRITFCNDAACRLIGYPHEELTGMRYDLLYKKPEIVFQTFNKVFSSGQPDRGFALEMVRKDGTTVYGELSISLIKDKDGTFTGFRGLARDITERIKFEEQLKYLSMHDQLTGLYNRTYFEEEMQRLERGRDYPITIICADVDGLKLVNDSMGHKQGDRVLVKCAWVLKQYFRASDILARVGGDEFAVILPRTCSDFAELIYKRIHRGIEEHNKSHPLQPLSISLGFATSLGPERTLDDAYKEADSNMYREKLHHSSGARTQVIDTLLAALNERDYIAEGHAIRLQELSLQMGKKVGLCAIELADLALLARVHDLGKVGIPDRILFKNGPLSRKEQKIMQQHPEKGFRIARASQDLAPISDLILRHHERWDGTGYPLGLKGKGIPVECRILAIVDAYDAMVHDRPYRKAFKKQDALEELQRCAGTQFDPELVEKFIEIMLEES